MTRMKINELADHLITMPLITQLNANCTKRPVSRVWPEWPLSNNQTDPTERFSLLNDAHNGSILILHAIFADNKEIDENR